MVAAHEATVHAQDSRSPSSSSAAASTARSLWLATCRRPRSATTWSGAERAWLTWEQAEPLSDAEVQARLFSYLDRSEPDTRAVIDFNWVHRELGRVGVTLQRLLGEYQAAAKQRDVRSYQYSQFCELYASWRDQRRLSTRQVHRPGEKLFLDYSGKKPSICDPDSGEVTEVELFVGVLGASC